MKPTKPNSALSNLKKLTATAASAMKLTYPQLESACIAMNPSMKDGAGADRIAGIIG